MKYKAQWDTITSDIETMTDAIANMKKGVREERGALAAVPLLVATIILTSLVGLTIWLL